MAANPDADVTDSVEIAAAAGAVYDMVTDLPTMTDLAAETTAMAWVNGDRAHPGATFKGTNCNGSRSWSTTCTVTDAEPGRVFAFDVRSGILPVAHWRYDIEATGDGTCRVTESTWDRRPRWFRLPAGWATGVTDRTSANARHIAQTLQRLKDKAEAG